MCASPGAPAERARQSFFPDGARSFEEIDRLSVGTDSLHGILFTLASLASIVSGTILFKLLAPKGSLWIGNGVQNLAAGIVLTPVALTFADVHAIDVTPSLIGDHGRKFG